MNSKESMSLSKDSEPHEIMLQLPRLRTKRFSILNRHPETENREDHDERIGTALEGPKAPTTPKIALTVPGKMIIKLTGSLFQSALTLFSCVMYVISTYSNKGSTFMVTIEYAVAGLFATDYFWGFIIAKDKRAFMLNPLNLVDLVTIFPVLLNILSNTQTNNYLTFTRILRIIRVVRILRLYRLFTTTKEIEPGNTALQSSDVKRQIMITIGTILAVLFISTGTIHTLSQSKDFAINLPSTTTELTFDGTFYYMIITIFTIGYGDYYPITTFSRAIIGLFIIIVIIIMGQQTTRLGELMKNTSPYRKSYKTDPNRHIVISGAFSGTTLFRFLKELYHIDHNMPMKSCKVLLVKNEGPSREILGILNHPIYEDCVQYLEGNLIDEDVLKSAAVKLCKGVFILTDQYSEDIGPSDTYAVLLSSAVKEYSPKTQVYLQLIKPDLLIHNYWAGWDSGFSTWELKLSMLAANVFTPGFSTLICNLIVSSSGTMKKVAINNHWMNEYITGLSNELYLVPFPENLYGIKFTDIVGWLYKDNCSLLIGVMTNIEVDDDENDIEDAIKTIQEILINPVDYFIKEGDNAFIIAPDLEDAQNINKCGQGGEDFKGSKDRFGLFRTTLPKRSTYKALDNRHLLMWETDLRGELWDHILVFGRLEHLEIIIESFSKMSNQIICYVSDESPGELWNRISRKNKSVLYLECTLSDIVEISHTAINFSYHVIILSSKIPGSSMDDSGTLPLVSIIENNFTVKFTVELVDEMNMKYLEHRLPVELESMNFLTWPRYAASHVFCSSALDYIIAQGYHNSFIIDLIQRMIVYQDLYAEINIDENCRINSITLPAELHGKTTFSEVFYYLLNLSRPVVALAIYRGVGILNNEIPYVFTKPDPGTPLFKGDQIIVLGELNNRESSLFLKDARIKQRKETVVRLSKKRSITKSSQNLQVKKSSPAEMAIKCVEEEEKYEEKIISDDELLNMIKNLMDKTKREREIISKQNETLLNLASEYSTVQGLLTGLDINESFNTDELNN